MRGKQEENPKALRLQSGIQFSDSSKSHESNPYSKNLINSTNTSFLSSMQVSNLVRFSVEL
jgi:hypothetical protein